MLQDYNNEYNEMLFDYTYLINNYRNMSNDTFMIALELSVKRRYGKINHIINELPHLLIERIFTSYYNYVPYKEQYSFLHSTYVPILLELSKMNKMPNNMISPHVAFDINRTQFVSAVASELDSIMFSKYYEDIYSNIDFDIDSWNNDKGSYELNVLESIINFYTNEMHDRLDNLRNIFIKDQKGVDYNRGLMEYRNFVRMIIPRIAESVVISFCEIVSDADFAELNAISNHNRYGMNRNELFDKVIERMLNSFDLKG